jgi:hypothetical protein
MCMSQGKGGLQLNTAAAAHAVALDACDSCCPTNVPPGSLYPLTIQSVSFSTLKLLVLAVHQSELLHTRMSKLVVHHSFRRGALLITVSSARCPGVSGWAILVLVF